MIMTLILLVINTSDWVLLKINQFPIEINDSFKLAVVVKTPYIYYRQSIFVGHFVLNKVIFVVIRNQVNIFSYM